MLELVLHNGKRAWLKRAEPPHVALVAEVPAPPGSTLRCTLRRDAHSLQIKVRSCRAAAHAQGQFEIWGSLVNLTREIRRLLTRADEGGQGSAEA